MGSEVRSRELEGLYERDWCESGLPPLTSRAAALWGKVRRDVGAAGVLGALLSEVRCRDLEGLYERDWCESRLPPLTSRAVALWGKVRRDMGTAGVLDTLLSEVRGRDLEGLYERDWCKLVSEANLSNSIADRPFPALVSTPADSADPQILDLAQFGLDLAAFVKTNQERTATDVVRSCSVGGSSFWSDAMDA